MLFPELDFRFGEFAEGGLPDETTVARFREAVYRFFRLRGRSFPWRQTRDPYRILVSEFMLQQTQTERVLPKYEAFVEALPNFAALASASLKEVFELWRGLGYNRRAKALLDTSVIVVREYGGILPGDPTALQTLPGIGPYTARAVSTFVFGRPLVFIETNIRRVYISSFFPEGAEVHDRQILPLVECTLDRTDPRSWYYALMDYGAALRKGGRNPNRRSAHYARQAPFENSNRQLRGRILAVLSSIQSASLQELADEVNVDSIRVASSLEGLEREGLVVREVGGFKIPDGEEGA